MDSPSLTTQAFKQSINPESFAGSIETKPRSSIQWNTVFLSRGGVSIISAFFVIIVLGIFIKPPFLLTKPKNELEKGDISWKRLGFLGLITAILVFFGPTLFDVIHRRSKS